MTTSDGDDDGAGGTANDGADDGSDGDADNGADNGADATGNTTNPGSGDAPQSGDWLYTDNGTTANDCTFAKELTNGVGDFAILDGGDGTFVVSPMDGTDAFDCEHADGGFDCPSRLVDETDGGAGSDAVLEVYVGIDGTLASSTAMNGTQNGEITCTGPDCGTIETVLATTFPCSFTLPFEGTAL